MAKILIIGNLERDVTDLHRFLSQKHQVHLAPNEQTAFARLKTEICDIIIFDLTENGKDSIVHLRKVHQHAPETPLIVTGRRERGDLFDKALNAGANDFFIKPLNLKKIDVSLDRELENRLLKNEVDYLRRQQDLVYDFSRIVAVSPNMRDVMSSIKKMAETDAAFLMTGESGTGKAFLAGAIHFNSRRRTKPFVRINCSNVPDTLLESELFGHEVGAFIGANKIRIGRFEQANGGTIFLDEISELSPRLQAEFLRAIDERIFERLGGSRKVLMHSRIISATNSDINKEMEKGNLREDLYYRISILRIHLPPLRERRDCIAPLARQLLEKSKRSMNKKIVGFSTEALEILKQYDWPGNIRELANVIERALMMEQSEMIQKENLLLEERVLSLVERTGGIQLRLRPDQKRDLIVDALDKSMWVQKEAAKRLSISPRALNYWIRKYGIKYENWRQNR